MHNLVPGIALLLHIEYETKSFTNNLRDNMKENRGASHDDIPYT